MNAVSVYGPVATAAEWGAAELGGTSLARITFWLKLEEAVAFGAVILVLDRLLRRDPEMRLRAHLLWSVNPLLLWEIVAGGHIDGLAAMFGLLGIAALRTRTPQRGEQPAHGYPDRRRRAGRPADRGRGRHKGGVRSSRPGRGLGLPPVAQGLDRRRGGLRSGDRAGLSGGRDPRDQGAPHPQHRDYLGHHVPALLAAGARVHPVQRVQRTAAPRAGRLPAFRGGGAAGAAALPGPGPRPGPSPRPWR